MHEAISMPREERTRRMRRVREVVAEHNVYRWAGKIVSTLLRIDSDEGRGASSVTTDALPLTDGERDAPPLAAARGA